MNINARIHYASFPGGSGRYENAFQAFDIKDGEPLIKLCDGTVRDYLKGQFRHWMPAY